MEQTDELKTDVKITDEFGSLRTMRAIEIDVMTLAIRLCGGNMAYAAKKLGMGRSTLYRMVKAYSIDHGRSFSQKPIETAA